MNNWDTETGYYKIPSVIWKYLETDIPKNAPDIWLSKPGGSHFLGMSFHFAPYNFPVGKGNLDNRFTYSVAPYHLGIIQDPFNSWGVKACLTVFLNYGPMEYWDWLPGILVVDTSIKYSLPDTKLAAFSGTEWADNDFRIFCGLYDLKAYDALIQNQLEIINRLTGPGWAGWPFGRRQLSESVITWVNSKTMLPEILLLASVRQFGVKYSNLNRRLYHLGDILGGWEEKPKETWDSRQSLRFLYQAKIMMADGLPEIALSTSIASLENAIAEVLLFLLNGQSDKVKMMLKGYKFLERFDKLLPKYGVQLPKTMFQLLRQAYFARNEVVHGLKPINTEKAEIHLQEIENVIVWFSENVGIVK